MIILSVCVASLFLMIAVDLGSSIFYGLSLFWSLVAICASIDRMNEAPK